MNVILEITPYLKDLIDSNEVKLLFEDKSRVSIKEVLNTFSKKYNGKLKERLFSEDGQILHSIFIFLNKHLVPWSKIDTTFVTEDVFISIIPAVAGG